MTLSSADLTNLLRALFDPVRDAPRNFKWRPLSGGHSGSEVMLVWPDAMDAIVVKAGDESVILREAEARAEYARHGAAAKQLEQLRGLGLSETSAPVEVRIDQGPPTRWRAMAYAFVGGLTYDEADRFTDFGTILREFVSNTSAVTPESLSRWLRALFETVRSQRREGPEAFAARRAPDFREYIPEPAWDQGIEPALRTVGSLLPASHELSELRAWWNDHGDRNKPAYHDKTLLHGDLRFANIFVDRMTNAVIPIDFGQVREGHVFADLAKFECDLLFRIQAVPRQRATDDEQELAVLIAASSGPFTPPHESDDNPKLKALAQLREIYNTYWKITDHSGGWPLYRWFVLAETLKRLRWFDADHTRPRARRFLIQAILSLKALNDQVAATPLNLGAIGHWFGRLGCIDAWVPKQGDAPAVNEGRNRAKVAALRRAAHAKDTVRLLAETGYSYIENFGSSSSRFYDEIVALLGNGGHFWAVIANPVFVEAHGISAAHQTSRLGESGIHADFTRKHDLVLDTYSRLRRRFGDHIEVRVARYGLASTVLMTSDAVFFEPYFRSNRDRRMEQLFDTFEIRLDPRRRTIQPLFQEHFQFHWQTATELEKFSTRKRGFADLLASVRKLWE